MGRYRRFFECSKCGAHAPKWAGQCGDCGDWNTLIEAVKDDKTPSKKGPLPDVQVLSEIPLIAEARTPTGIGELDRVLGGGLVAGSVVLMGGDPGIGKSTLLTQALATLGASQGMRTLYVAGEESPAQVRMRAERLGMDTTGVGLITNTLVEDIIAIARKEKPDVMVIDSIQTVNVEALQSAPGSVAQVRESAAKLVRFAKHSSTSLFLIGHVTKEGSLAGPRVLEHMVDTVLYFEGDSGDRYRIIRTVKNRFGAVNELGVFAMTDTGLREVLNPSAIFLSRHEQAVPGSVVMVTREGTRPLLVEVQALVDEAHGPNARRVTLGLDQNRLAMLLAVLHRHGGVTSWDQNVFVNIVGGVRVTETAADLAVLLAVVSSMRDRPLPNDLVVFGEVGLAGEVRPVPNGPERLREAAKHGFKTAIVPAANARNLEVEGIEIKAVDRLEQALAMV